MTSGSGLPAPSSSPDLSQAHGVGEERNRELVKRLKEVTHERDSLLAKQSCSETKMAECRDTAGVEELEKEITCAICHEHYTDPKVLSCCHYYCKACIHRLALRTGLDKPFSCPECRKDTTLPQGSVDNLQGAFFVNRMKNVHSKLERATGKVEAKCEMCSGAKAEAFCRQCVMFICAECVGHHQKLKVFAGHKISSLEEIKEGGAGAKEILTQEPTLSTCKLHKEPMKIYCFDCSCLICRDCIIKDHNGHNYEFVSVAGPAMKKKLIQQLEPLKEIKAAQSHAVEKIQTTKSEVKAQTHSMTSSIERSFDEYHQILEQCKQELVTEVMEKEAYKLEQLSNQEKGLSTICAEAQSVTDYTAQCVEHSADDEIMCMHAELQSLIDTAIQQQQEGVKNLEPVEEADLTVEVSLAEELKRLCLSKAKITQLPKKCTLTQQNAEVNEPCRAVLKSSPSNGKSTIVLAHLKSLVNGSTTQCQVESVKDGEYCIQYTPSVRGRHELTVTLNGLEVTGSPFPVFVSIHPSQLGKPVRAITCFSATQCVAVNVAEEIIVADSKNISVFDKSGKKLRSCNLNISKVPWGMAVDTDGCVYITLDNKVLKLSPDLKLLKEVAVDKKSWIRGVAVVGDEVMVCDYHNHVLVYTKELKQTRLVTAHGSQSIHWYGISSDQNANLYIGDPQSDRLHVYNNSGAFLRSFGKGRIRRPWSVCVAGQYVYVSNNTGNNISVFTTEGEHVATFGQEGKGEGDLTSPYGVCVDRDGFVYVCDQANRRIQIF